MPVFVAGPYGDHRPPDGIAANIARAAEAGRWLEALGHTVFVPHTFTPGLGRPDALALCVAVIRHWAEAVYRVPGESPGADAEVALAAWLGLALIAANEAERS